MHRFARNDAGRLHVDAAAVLGLDGALAVDGVAQRIHDAAQKFLADGNGHDLARLADGVAFLDVAVVAENNDTDVVDFKVERHTLDAVAELDHLPGLDLVETVDAGDAVADRHDAADFGHFGMGVEVGDLLFQDG